MESNSVCIKSYQRRESDLFITNMITVRIARHEVNYNFASYKRKGKVVVNALYIQLNFFKINIQRYKSMFANLQAFLHGK